MALHVGADVRESMTAYLVICNAQYLQRAGGRLVATVCGFTSAYLRNRCLLKLATWLPAGELDALFAQFMDACSGAQGDIARSIVMSSAASASRIPIGS